MTNPEASRGEAETKSRPARDWQGKYMFDGNFDRLCQCGHTLGAHIHGGFECGTNPMDNPETKGCDCQKFRPSKTKKKRTAP